MDFTIPYETSKELFRYQGVTVVESYLDNGQQMPYVMSLTKSGLYREWVSRKTDEELEAYIKENEKRLTQGMNSKVMAPHLKEYQHYLYRNCLYMVELYMRHNTDTTQLDADLENYHAVWKGRYEVKLMDWMKKNDAFKPIEEQSGVNPYY